MATLDDIVSAAAKVFRTKGYHAATVRDIADEVGILKGSLYHHFDSKEDLLYLVVKEPIAQMFRTISEIAAADGTATEKLRRAISAHLEAFDRHYPHLFVYLRERESVKRRFREMIGFSPKEYERCWQQIIREGVETGEFRAGARHTGRLLRPLGNAQLALQMVRPAGPARACRKSPSNSPHWRSRASPPLPPCRSAAVPNRRADPPASAKYREVSLTKSPRCPCGG